MLKKIKLIESTISQSINNNTDEVIEDLSWEQKPDFTITDVTVLPDENYNPTIQSCLIQIEENQQLREAEKLGFNILSETVNPKTGYSHSLFEFETRNKTITLNLSMTESEKYNGVWKVSAHTTRGELVFESTTQHPQKVITNYLNSLSSEYLLEADSTIENQEMVDIQVYQIKEISKCPYAFMKYDYAKGDISKDDYDLVATITLPKTNEIDNLLNTVFDLGNTHKDKFDMIKPMRSISVSDIIEIDNKFYYVDSFGFKELEEL